MLKLIKFGASWCNPCKRLKPEFDALKTETTGVTFLDVDIDQEEGAKLATKHKVLSIPTILVHKDNKEVARLTGFRTKAQLIDLLNTLN